MGPAHGVRQPNEILIPVTTDVPLALTLEVQQIQHPLFFFFTKLNLISITQCGTCSAPVLFAVRQELSCSCLPEETAFPTLTEILTLSQMLHAIMSEKLRELTSAPSFYHLSPSYSLTRFSSSKKPLIFILFVSNKTGTNGSWQNMFSVSAENLSA